jgi:beta-glucanase (GH16 family)
MTRLLRGPAAVGMVALAALLVAHSAASPAARDHAGRLRLAWHQEFSGRAGARLDSRHWTYEVGDWGQGNGEWEYYTRRRQNVSTDGRGHLAIIARRQRLPGMANCPHGPCDITSGRVTTKYRFAQAYGRFEARIKIPSGHGLWPAFWLLGDNIDRVGWPACGEIDVMEAIGRQPRTAYGTIHAPGYADSGIGGSRTLRRALSDAFHVYGLDWSPRSVTWTLDGRPYFTARRANMQPGQSWPFDHPFYVLLNLAVGGNWPGPPDATTHFPAKMLVDWVRVYRRK